MIWFLVRRLGFFVGAGLAASVLIFVLIRAAGGNVAAVILGRNASAEAITELESSLGLRDPLIQQYGTWLMNMLRGDLGTSFRTGRPVVELVADSLPISIPLAVMGLGLALIVSIPLGTYAAVKANSPIGTIISLLSQVGIAVPVFWAGVLLALTFGVWLGWLPTGGWVPWSQDPWRAFKSLVLPALSLGLILGASLTRYVRTSVLEVMNEDYVRTARASGMSRTEALTKVALRNAALPILTVIGIQVVDLVAGTVLIETVFSLPGLARTLLSAVTAREVIVVQSTVMLVVLFVLIVNLLVDLSYGLLDPRVRVGER
ncbi:ABC transporter permease [Tessaracoccus sp.]